jgi:hypothetical protein
MSHTTVVNLGAPLGILGTITVTNYVNGTGETFTLAEFGLSSKATNVTAVALPSNNNSLSAVIFPVNVSNSLRLYQVSGGALVEVPTTNGLNAVLNILMFALND